MVWQVQEAKQRFSEVVRRATVDGPQIVTKHGAEIAVVMDIAQFRRLTGDPHYRDFNDWLVNGPRISLSDDEIDAVFERDRSLSTRDTPFAGLG